MSHITCDTFKIKPLTDRITFEYKVEGFILSSEIVFWLLYATHASFQRHFWHRKRNNLRDGINCDIAFFGTRFDFLIGAELLD